MKEKFFFDLAQATLEESENLELLRASNEDFFEPQEEEEIEGPDR
jgi:hypothetical protein